MGLRCSLRAFNAGMQAVPSGCLSLVRQPLDRLLDISDRSPFIGGVPRAL